VTKLEAWRNREEKIVVEIEIIIYQLFMFSFFMFVGYHCIS
jgi:hypothetical protein